MNRLLSIARRVVSAYPEGNERRRLSKLYSPDPGNLDAAAHHAAAVEWLKRAQDAGEDRGVSYGVRFGEEFDVSYPETTGYICQTFVRLWRRTGDSEYLTRAVEMGDWEIAIQLPEGAVMGGKFNRNPTPAVFNTGMVLLGWAELIRATGEERFRRAAARAGEWLLGVQEPDGNWIRGNSHFAAAGITTYNSKTAWGLCEAGIVLDRRDFVDGALRNAAYCLKKQQPNGWFRDCCLTDSERPLLHTIGYAMQGLLEVGRLTGREDLICAAQTTADAQVTLLGEDGFLPGRQDAHFHPAADWCCPCGSAQVSVVLNTLAGLGLDRGGRYREAAARINRYLMARHDIRNPDPRLRGGVPGSWPVHGEYGKYRILNWATKFLVDALEPEAAQASTA